MSPGSQEANRKRIRASSQSYLVAAFLVQGQTLTGFQEEDQQWPKES